MQRVLLYLIKATYVFRVNTACGFTTARGRILDGFPSGLPEKSDGYKYFQNTGKSGLAAPAEMG